MVVFPAVIHYSQEEKLCIHFSSLTEAVHLAITLQVSTQNHTLVERDVEKPGTFQCIAFQVSVAVAADLAVGSLTFTSDMSPALLWVSGYTVLCFAMACKQVKYIAMQNVAVSWSLAKWEIFHV